MKQMNLSELRTIQNEIRFVRFYQLKNSNFVNELRTKRTNAIPD